MEEEMDGEIKKALQQFEKEFVPIPNRDEPEVFQSVTSSKLVLWIMKHSGGKIKKERQAEYIIFSAVILMIACSFYLFYTSSSKVESDIPLEPFLGQPDVLDY